MINTQHILNYPGIIQTFGSSLSLKKNYQISTDSRRVSNDTCFLAIKGEVHDAFKFISSLENCEISVFESSKEKDLEAKNLSGFLVSVDSIKDFIFYLCKAHAQDCYDKGVKTIAISGSNGKTTTKEMLKHLFDSLSIDVIATKKNDNNHFGVPFTIFRLNPDIHKYAIVEYGSNHPGEMELLCKMTFPEVGITTNIGHTHMEFFKTTTDVFKEETKIFHRIYGLTNGEGFFLINNDDEHIKNLTSKGSKTFGRNKSDFNYTFENGFVLNGDIKIKNSNIIGDYNFSNLANAFNIANFLINDRQSELLEACASFSSTNNRSQWISWKNKKVFLDAYNANPSSMRVAIKAYLDHIQRNNLESAALLIGDMNELGENSKKYHEELGSFVSGLSLPVIYIGKYSDDFKKGFDKNFKTFLNINNVDWDVELNNYKNVFAKASRSLQLEKIFDINK